MDTIEVSPEVANWKSRGVTYLRGPWSLIRAQIPHFELGSFQAAGAPIENPFYRVVYRLPRTPLEHRVPVGIVSNTYTLAQHYDVADLCLEGLRACGIDTSNVVCELGLSALGEWMNFRVILPDNWIFQPGDNYPLSLRLECFNSVEGGCCLELQFGWHRLICKNGLIIKESMRRIREVHNAHLDVKVLKDLVKEAFASVSRDRMRLLAWHALKIQEEQVAVWADGPLSSAWGKLAAFRVYHICSSGYDAEYEDPFESERPTRKASKRLGRVPGAPEKAGTIYEVSQALSYVASHRRNADERGQMLTSIPDCLRKLDARAA